jgi:hypothetical protein
VSSYRADIDSLAELLDERYREKTTPARLLRRAQDLATRSLSWDVTFIVDHESTPIVIGHSCENGEVRGTAYLFDHRLGRIACAARIFATSSGTVRLPAYRPTTGLELGTDSTDRDRAAVLDLDTQVLRRIALDMRFQAGPPRVGAIEPED